MMTTTLVDVKDMGLTDEQKRQFAAWLADFAGQGDDLGEIDDRLMCITATRDEFDRYDGSAWSEAVGRFDDTLPAGEPVRHFDSVQVAEGRPRVTLAVADFGDVRAVYQL